VLVASAVVVLKHETSILRQSHNFISIDLKFGVCDNVREITSIAKLNLDLMSGQNAPYGQHIRVLGLFVFYRPIFVFVHLFFNRATAHTREPILRHTSSKDAVWCTEDPFGVEKCVILKYGGVSP